ncbi:Lsr2 family protein [Streptomyces scabiei]|uniref:histone-like nucleoid-structuring protein Lsr2 n=1 Tax=Streptomyces scabiei TaxID=1930 RepID=UPI0033ED1DD7
MAQLTRVILLDDLANDDTTEADETVHFSLDGVDYEIDLTNDNAHKLRARLKEFKQAGRVVNRSAKRTTRAMTEPAGAGATLSRHQGGTDPAAARAWAISQGLIPKEQRGGRLGTKYKDAYRASLRGDTGPLNKLKQELGNNSTTPAEKPNTPPQPPTQAAGDTKPTPDTAAPTQAHEDAYETEARKHYKPLEIRSPEMQDDKKWRRRTAHGCPRTDKVEQMTLAERVQAVGGGLSNRNTTILAQLAGIVTPKNGKVAHLTGSALRLQNLEMIRYAPDSEHGWEITDFGRYAHQFHTMGE